MKKFLTLLLICLTLCLFVSCSMSSEKTEIESIIFESCNEHQISTFVFNSDGTGSITSFYPEGEAGVAITYIITDIDYTTNENDVVFTFLENGKSEEMIINTANYGQTTTVIESFEDFKNFDTLYFGDITCKKTDNPVTYTRVALMDTAGTTKLADFDIPSIWTTWADVKIISDLPGKPKYTIEKYETSMKVKINKTNYYLGKTAGTDNLLDSDTIVTTIYQGTEIPN